jgi:hypothetical protein
MRYANHLIKYSHVGSEKPWKLLLLDSHESHKFMSFQLKYTDNYIRLFYFLSHFKHIL